MPCGATRSPGGTSVIRRCSVGSSSSTRTNPFELRPLRIVEHRFGLGLPRYGINGGNAVLGHRMIEQNLGDGMAAPGDPVEDGRERASVALGFFHEVDRVVVGRR